MASPCWRVLLLAVLCVAVPGGVLAGQEESPAAADAGLVDERAQGAVAAVLVATLGERFGDVQLEVRLGAAKLAAAGPRDQVVLGVGELRFGSSEDWFAFRYRTRYDPASGGAGYPEITLGSDGQADGEHFVPNDARRVAELESLVAEELEALPGAGRVHLQLDDISSLQSGQGFLHIEASGIADFGAGGSTDARIEALYDLQVGVWRSIEHTLAPHVRERDDGGTAGF